MEPEPDFYSASDRAERQAAATNETAQIDADPSQAEVPLRTASADWKGSLIHDNEGTGIWAARVVPFFPQYGTPEVIGLDDRGRCIVGISYSGKWTTRTVLEEEQWLGALAHGDVDGRIAGDELYVGGQRGNLYQVLPHMDGLMDARRIAEFPGREIHTIVAGTLDPTSEGAELLVFTRPGALFRVSPTGRDGTFEAELLGELSGRVRDAVILPAESGRPREIATVTRAGRVEILTLELGGPRWHTIHEAPMGLGRLALAPARADRGTVLYATHDDGRVIRLERSPDGGWEMETIHAGAQGPRGLAAGRFHSDPNVETVALFGYSANVELLSRDLGDGNRWTAKTIFVDKDKGHSLCAAELDGRNETDELVGTGYSGRIFLLARPATVTASR